MWIVLVVIILAVALSVWLGINIWIAIGIVLAIVVGGIVLIANLPKGKISPERKHRQEVEYIERATKHLDIHQSGSCSNCEKRRSGKCIDGNYNHSFDNEKRGSSQKIRAYGICEYYRLY